MRYVFQLLCLIVSIWNKRVSGRSILWTDFVYWFSEVQYVFGRWNPHCAKHSICGLRRHAGTNTLLRFYKLVSALNARRQAIRRTYSGGNRECQITKPMRVLIRNADHLGTSMNSGHDCGRQPCSLDLVVYAQRAAAVFSFDRKLAKTWECIKAEYSLSSQGRYRRKWDVLGSK